MHTKVGESQSGAVADLRWHPLPPNVQILIKLCLSHENEKNNQASHTFCILRKIKKIYIVTFIQRAYISVTPIRVRIGPPHPLVCPKRRLIGDL